MRTIVFLELEESFSEVKKGSGRGVCAVSRLEMSQPDTYMEPFIGKKMGSRGVVRGSGSMEG